jgi:hypothetical protein
LIEPFHAADMLAKNMEMHGQVYSGMAGDEEEETRILKRFGDRFARFLQALSLSVTVWWSVFISAFQCEY